MSKTKIEWADETWNVVTGCTKVSAGCKNCYAETWAGRKMGEWANRDFSEVKFYPERLSIPSKRKKPTRFFVNSMSDLFHEKVSYEEIDKIIEVILENPRHTFQVLTKRPLRALRYFENMIALEADNYLPDNLWMGVSVENQDQIDRVHLLHQIPAKVKFLSCEPLLSNINLDLDILKIDWVIVGGESGRNARPIHPNWVRSIRDQCQDAKVKFFFKQWGEWAPRSGYITGGGINWGEIDPQCKKFPNVIRLGEHGLNTRISENCNEQMGQEIFVQKVGKSNAGRILDGREWNEFPEVSNVLL